MDFDHFGELAGSILIISDNTQTVIEMIPIQ